MSNERRRGWFAISMDFKESCPGLVQRIMGECVITRAQQYDASRVIVYEAESRRFDPVPDGEATPSYIWFAAAADDLVDCRRVS